MRMNWTLRRKIVQRFGTQVEAAQALGIRENRLSNLIRGRVRANNRERAALKKAFGKHDEPGATTESAAWKVGARGEGNLRGEHKDEPSDLNFE